MVFKEISEDKKPFFAILEKIPKTDLLVDRKK